MLVLASCLALLLSAGTLLVLLPSALAGPVANLCEWSGIWTSGATLATHRSGQTSTLLPNGKVLIAGGSNGGGSLASAELYDPGTGVVTPTGSMATARFDHSATLLANGKVLIAGGVNTSTGRLSSAELYDPSTGTFTPTGSMRTDRQDHVAVLLPTGRVLILGGFGTTPSGVAGFLATAEVYDPGSGNFTATGSMGTARRLHTATVLAAGTVLVAGGENGGGDLASTEIFNPATGTFTPSGSLGTFRALHSATLLANGKVLIAGGDNVTGALSTAELYDPVSGTTSWTGAMATARTRHTATLLPQGKVLMVGGAGSGALAAAEVYDPERARFTPIDSLATARFDHTATLLLDGTVLVAGGQNASGALASLELYDPPFIPTAPMGVRRTKHAATLLPGGKVLITGGLGVGSLTLASAELYDPATDSFTPTGSMNAARRDHTAVLLLNGKVLVAGGLSGSATFLASAELYDPATGVFTPTASMGAARSLHSATLLPSGKVLIAGGFNISGGGIASAVLYNPATGSFTATGTMTRDRRDHTATLLANGKVLMTGGWSDADAGITFSTELYDPATGTFSAQPLMLTNRMNHTATLLANGKVLITGGLLTTLLDPTNLAELYDPDTESFSATGAMATRRFRHAATPTQMPHGEILIVGGTATISGTTVDSAELYDPTTGTFRPAGRLSLDRTDHTVTLLNDGGVLVTGGESNFGGLRASAEVSKPTLCRTGLWVTQTDSPDPIVGGNPLTYIVTVENTGPGDISGITLSDSLPAGVTFESVTATQGSCSRSGAQVSCGLGTLANGENAVVTIVITPTGAGQISNTATVTGSPDPDTSDNTSTITTTVIAALIDLVESAVSNPPASALSGSSFSVTDTARNDGNFAAAPSTTRYYLSADAVLGGADALLAGSRGVPGLAPGASSSGTVMATIPAGTPPGAYFLLACADDTQGVAEISESNNCRASSTLIQVIAPVVDLVETAVGNPPASALPGDSFSVTDTARNQGTVEAAASTTRYYLSLDALAGGGDTLLAGSRAVPALAPGATSTAPVVMTIPSSATPGMYFLLACADDTGVVGESDESNNCRASASRLQLLAPVVDLVHTAVTNPPATALPGGGISVTDTARNQGTVAAGASTTQYYLSSDAAPSAGDTLLVGNRAVPALVAGAVSTGTVALTIPASTEPGTYFLLACADDTRIVPEIDETNNCRAAVSQIQVILPDLVEASVSNPPASAERGTSFSATDTTRNQGTAAAGASTVRYYLSLNAVWNAGDIGLTGTRAVAQLAPGAESAGTVTLTIPSSAASGAYFVLACADDTSVVIEHKEDNNCRASSTTVQVLEPRTPDLVEATVSDSPLVAALGSSFTVTDTVRNRGQGTAGASTTRYYLSLDGIRVTFNNLLTGTRAVPALAAGAESTGTVTVKIPFTIVPGIYRLMACADNLEVVAESDDENNCRASLIHMEVTVPDLVATAVSNPPATVEVGGAFSVTDTVRNQGGASARTSRTRYYLSLDQRRNKGDKLLKGVRLTPVLAAGEESTETVTVSLKLTVKPGNYFLLACADDTDLVFETNDTNNCVSSATRVTVTP